MVNDAWRSDSSETSVVCTRKEVWRVWGRVMFLLPSSSSSSSSSSSYSSSSSSDQSPSLGISISHSPKSASDQLFFLPGVTLPPLRLSCRPWRLATLRAGGLVVRTLRCGPWDERRETDDGDLRRGGDVNMVSKTWLLLENGRPEGLPGAVAHTGASPPSPRLQPLQRVPC